MTASATKTSRQRKSPAGNKKKQNQNQQNGNGSASTQRQKVEEEIADRIIQLLDQGDLPPWEKDWANSPNQGSPLNAVSMKPYRGINRLMTLITQFAMGYNDPRWLTFRQAETLGGHIAKGETSTRVVFWKRVARRKDQDEDETGEEKGKSQTYPLLRAYGVFNVAQTRDCCLKPLEVQEEEMQTHERVQAAQEILERMPDPPALEHYQHANHAPHYQPSGDIIRVPELGRFRTPDGYYNTLFHEMTHSTGHPRRLHRFELDANAKDLHAYGREELVAAMGSAMLIAHAGISPETQLRRDAAYIQHWRDAIQADKPMVLRAATLAQRAIDLILDQQPPEFTSEKPGAEPENRTE